MYVLIPASDFYPKSKYIYLFLLLIFVDKLISTPKIITVSPNPIPGDKKLPCLSNQIPYPEYLYLLISAFSVRISASNKQFCSVG